MKCKPIDILLVILSLLPIAAVLILYPSLPAQVPVHWSLDGQVRYSDKATLWLLCGLPVLLFVMMKVLPKIDPRRENFKRFGKYYDITILCTTLVLDLVFTITVIEALRPGTVSVSRVITCAVGVLFMVLGNVMPKFKSNFFAGARTPWALSDPDVWNRTQRLSGMLFFVLGLVLAVCGLFLSDHAMFAVLAVGVAVLITVPSVMSFLWYRQKHNGDKT